MTYVFDIATRDVPALHYGSRVVYDTWYNMVKRCYDPREHVKRPAYAKCEVDHAWLTFSSFGSWMSSQAYVGMALDKDLLHPGNTLYTASRCLFIPTWLNTFLTGGKARSNTVLPIGVYMTHSQTNPYAAKVHLRGKQIYLGSYRTPGEAHLMYRAGRRELFDTLISEASDPRIKEGLRKHKERE